jgi:hypothetical protein
MRLIDQRCAEIADRTQLQRLKSLRHNPFRVRRLVSPRCWRESDSQMDQGTTPVRYGFASETTTQSHSSRVETKRVVKTHKRRSRARRLVIKNVREHAAGTHVAPEVRQFRSHDGNASPLHILQQLPLKVL